MVIDGITGESGPGDWGSTIFFTTGSTGATSTATSSDCCPVRFPTYTEAKEKQKKGRRKKNNPLPPWLRAKTKHGQF